jgi:hypothetical protein
MEGGQSFARRVGWACQSRGWKGGFRGCQASRPTQPTKPTKPTNQPQDLEDGVDKGGGGKDFEEKLAEALFADNANDGTGRESIKTDDIANDAFTTEASARGWG